MTRITDQITAWPGLDCGLDPLADFGRECQHGHLRRKCEMCEVLAERTALESRLRTTAEALRELYALVEGECPALLDEDRGGTVRLAMDCDAILARLKQEGLT